jgi:two-component system chemotaxis response regulator CheB
MIASESGFEVAATACSGSDALDKIPSLDPDVITLDVEMPGLDGLQTLRCIMRRFPRPVIMVSAATEKDADNTFDALAAGAFDYVPKQLSPRHSTSFISGQISWPRSERHRSHETRLPSTPCLENLPVRASQKTATQLSHLYRRSLPWGLPLAAPELCRRSYLCSREALRCLS